MLITTYIVITKLEFLEETSAQNVMQILKLNLFYLNFKIIFVSIFPCFCQKEAKYCRI